MANYSLNINLLKIDGASLQTNPATGKRAVVIPVEEADIFVNESNTAAYLGMNMYESHNSQYGDSHSLKLKFSKATIDRIGVDAIKAKPFIGNAKEKLPYGQQGQPAQPAPAPSNNDNWNW